MGKMTHWNSTETITVPDDKKAVYAAQGWVDAGKTAAPVAREAATAMTKAAVDEPAPAKKTAAKKAPAKKAAKKS